MNWQHTNPAVPASRLLGLILLSVMLLVTCAFGYDALRL